MKKIFLLLGIIFSSAISFSQTKIKLPDNSFQLENRKFYVTEVIDIRSNKKFIGEIWKGAFKKTDKITVEGGINHYLQNWFLSNFPKTSDSQSAVKVFIKDITISQSFSYSREVGKVYSEFEFINTLNDKQKIYSIITEETDDAFSSHPQRMISAFRDCAVKYNNTIPDSSSEKISESEDVTEIIFNNNTDIKEYNQKLEKVRLSENRNIIAVGYQIGGYTLLGIDYEVRVHDYLGIHFGAGFLGYTAGIKIHTNKKKNSMFFNASWKDSGLGMLNGFALEGGGRWIWSKKRDFGLYYQAGILAINHIDDDFADILFGSVNVPNAMLSMGIGLSW